MDRFDGVHSQPVSICPAEGLGTNWMVLPAFPKVFPLYEVVFWDAALPSFTARWKYTSPSIAFLGLPVSPPSIQVTNDRECYDTDEEWKQHLDEKKKRAGEFNQKIADALGFDTSVASVSVSQVVSEVFGVAYIREKKV